MARYSAEDKQAALDCLAAHEGDFKQTSAALGISESTLRKWAREARVQGHELGQLRAGLAALQDMIRDEATPDESDQSRTQRKLLLQLGQDAIRLSESIEEVIDEAPLNQRASALNQILDKYLKLMALLPQRGPQEIHVRFIDPDDGSFDEAPFWATRDSGS
jgi:transposase-like protein